MRFHVDSEVGTLKQAIVHRPGIELSRLTPANVDELLFDDVMWADRARQEHDSFVAQLEGHGVVVHHFATLLAEALDEPAIRRALREGHAYVSHDWICDPTGFRFEAVDGPGDSPRGLMGDEVKGSPALRLVAQFPVSCRIRILRDGRTIEDRVGDRLDVAVKEPGVYRVEGWLTLDGEERPWIYANPIYVR